MESKDLKKVIDVFNETTKPRMFAGHEYYRRRNIAILRRVKEFFSMSAGRNVEDCTKANHKLASGFTRILVDQKVYYSINGKLVIEGIDDTELNVSKFRKTLKKLGFNASNEIYGVLFWYIDSEDNQLKYKILESQQIILVNNADDNDIIDSVIRVYTENNEEFADVIDAAKTTHYKLVNGDWTQTEAEEYHLTSTTKSGKGGQVLNVTTDEEGWGRVPVSILYNNSTRQTDLEMFKSDVDMYDVVKSDFGNNFEDFQEMYWVLRGYKGQDAATFMEEFKKSRILKVSKDGDAKQVAQEVPYEARVAMLNVLTLDIYRFGMGVDPTNIKGDTTNLTIKALFANLDLKANGFEEEIQEFMDSVVYFINKANALNDKGTNIEDLTIKFSRATILNKQEIITGLISQSGFRAKKNLLEEHPDVTDVEQELADLEAERVVQMNRLGAALGFEEE